MKSPFLWLTKMLLLPVVLNCGGECFAQEKGAGAENDQKPLNNGPSEVKTKPRVGGPAVVFSTQVIQESVVNGVRKIVATGNGDKVEIADTNGQNIALKLTRMVGGKSETMEVQADDLADLKSKSPEAAALYEKYALRQAAPAQIRVRFQIPNQGFIRTAAAQQQSSSSDDFPSGVGPRKIHVELEDRRIEIFDSVDESILLKQIKTVDGRDQVEEFTADNLKQFKNLHPEAYLLYKKYTGLKTDEEN